MLRIRLRRVGKKKQPMYRIVVADSRSPRDGAFVESIGYYRPLDDPSTIVLDPERTRHWLGKGAQPSERVSKLLAIQGIADLPPKLKARIELGQQRAKEAEHAKKEKAAEAPAAQAPAAEAAPEAPPEAEASAEEAAGEPESPPAGEPAGEEAAEREPAAEPEAATAPEVAEEPDPEADEPTSAG